MPISDALLEELLKHCSAEDVLNETGAIKELKKRMMEKMLHAEMEKDLGYPKNQKAPKNQTNRRNGTTRKRIISQNGDIDLHIPRDREAQFDPKLIGKYQRRIPGFDDKIIAMYARGMSTRDIQEHIEEIYGTDVSANLISDITDSVLDDVHAWQNRPLDALYPIIFFDALRIKIRDNGRIINKAIYVVLAVTLEGQKEVLGLWSSENEGAKFWAQIANELHNRGVQDIFIACVDGIKGFDEALNSVFPKTDIQLCVVHMIRYSLKFVSYKHRKALAADLKSIYSAITEQEALSKLDDFSQKWDSQYPLISESWRRNWDRLMTFMVYPEFIRKAIYTTNAIESLNHSLRKILKTKSVFPNDQSAFKLLYLGLKNISKRWTMPIRNWGQALNQFAIFYPDRFPKN